MRTSAASKTFFNGVVGFTLTVHAMRKIVTQMYEFSVPSTLHSGC